MKQIVASRQNSGSQYLGIYLTVVSYCVVSVEVRHEWGKTSRTLVALYPVNAFYGYSVSFQSITITHWIIIIYNFLSQIDISTQCFDKYKYDTIT